MPEDDSKTKSVYSLTEPKNVDEGIEYYPEPDGNGDITDAVSDIPASTRVKLTKYMSDWSKGLNEDSIRKDKYIRDPVESSDQLKSTEVSVKSNKRIEPSNSDQFNQDFRRKEHEQFIIEKDGIDTQKIGNKDLDYIKNELVGDKIGKLGDPGVKYVSSVLGKNRWNPDNRRVEDGSISIPRQLSGINEGSIKQEEESERYNENQYTSIGATLSARASIEKGSGEEGYDVNSASAEVWGILPGMSQLGLKTSTSRFDAKDILEKSGASEPDFMKINDLSWGTMNSPIDRYTGNSSMGMTALAIALMLGTMTVIEPLLFIIDICKSDDENGKTSKGVLSQKGNKFNGVYDLGSFRKKSTKSSPGFPPLPLDLTAWLGLEKTNNEWAKCVRKGMLIFFGSDADPGGLFSGVFGSLGDSFRAAVENPGFYIVFVRSIVRSSLIIFDQIRNLASSFGSGNIFDGVKQTLDLADIISRSKLMAALNLFARLGDSALDVDESTSIPVYDGKRKYSYSDSIKDDDPRASISKSRLLGDKIVFNDNGTHALAWSGRNSGVSVGGNVFGTTLLVPNIHYREASKLGYSNSWFNTYATFVDGPSRAKMQLISGKNSTIHRINSDDVEKIERVLDGQYVPFYFHDLRTNEIISFHAFLTSLSDQFSPEWNESTGFGRVDQVYTYKSTKRKIQLGFVVAATSKEDFQDMWLKINKLVTLVYPQYTEGTRVTTDEGLTSFVQPFSQMYSASPIVRIRLGDLLRTNYSKFALARLFGATTEGFKIKGTSIDIKEDNGTTTLQDILLKDGKKKDLNGQKYFVHPTNVHHVTYELDSDTNTSVFSNSFTKLCEGKTLTVKVKKLKEFDDGTEKAEIEILSVGKDPFKLNANKFYISTDMLNLNSFETLKKIEKEIKGDPQEYSNLFSPENNAIVKSFKSTGGRGLAGVINDLSFDFYENITWETGDDSNEYSGIGSQAPKLCRISISFSPIHDIAPGIDHTGFNRAPVYPVGHPYPRSDEDKKNGGS